MSTPKVFLDTVILKYSDDRWLMSFPRDELINWDGHDYIVPIYSFGTFLPNAKLHSDIKREANLLRHISKLAIDSKIEILVGDEVYNEFVGISIYPVLRGKPFYGAPIMRVKAPLKYSRSWGKAPLVALLKSLNDQRFKELQIACGAYQGPDNTNENQLIDAFHIFCAEDAGADYFLTCDKKLIRLLKQHKRFPPKPKVLLPSMLLKDLGVNSGV